MEIDNKFQSLVADISSVAKNRSLQQQRLRYLSEIRHQLKKSLRKINHAMSSCKHMVKVSRSIERAFFKTTNPGVQLSYNGYLVPDPYFEFQSNKIFQYGKRQLHRISKIKKTYASVPKPWKDPLFRPKPSKAKISAPQNASDDEEPLDHVSKIDGSDYEDPSQFASVIDEEPSDASDDEEPSDASDNE